MAAEAAEVCRGEKVKSCEMLKEDCNGYVVYPDLLKAGLQCSFKSANDNNGTCQPLMGQMCDLPSVEKNPKDESGSIYEAIMEYLRKLFSSSKAE